MVKAYTCGNCNDRVESVHKLLVNDGDKPLYNLELCEECFSTATRTLERSLTMSKQYSPIIHGQSSEE